MWGLRTPGWWGFSGTSEESWFPEGAVLLTSGCHWGVDKTVSGSGFLKWPVILCDPLGCLALRRVCVRYACVLGAVSDLFG